MKNKSTILKYSISLAVGILIAYAVMHDEGAFAAETIAKDRARFVSDGFFVPALLMTGVGLLIWVASTGLFDIFSYAVSSVISRFIPGKSKEFGNYYDYHTMKDENRTKPQLFLVICGLFFLGLSFLALAVYHRL